MSKEKSGKSRYYSAKRIKEIMENIKNNKDKFIEKLGKNWQKFKLRCVLLGGVAALTLSGCSFAEKNYSETPTEIEEAIQDVETQETEETGLICVLERTVVDENNPNESHIEREQITAESIQQAIKQAEELGYNTIGIKLPKEYTLTRSVKIPDGFKVYLYGDENQHSSLYISIRTRTPDTSNPDFQLGKGSEFSAAHFRIESDQSITSDEFIVSKEATRVALSCIDSPELLVIEGSSAELELDDCSTSGLTINGKVDNCGIKNSTTRSIENSGAGNIVINGGKHKHIKYGKGSNVSILNSYIGILELEDSSVTGRGCFIDFADLDNSKGEFENCQIPGAITMQSQGENNSVSLDNCRVDFIVQDSEKSSQLSMKNCSGNTNPKGTTVEIGDEKIKVPSGTAYESSTRTSTPKEGEKPGNTQKEGAGSSSTPKDGNKSEKNDSGR